MNIGLFSGPASRVTADLLVFLVAEKANIHTIHDPAISAVGDDATALFCAPPIPPHRIQQLPRHAAQLVHGRGG